MAGSYTADSVMKRAAALLNDRNRALFDDTVMLPYLQSAQEELEQEFNLNEVETNLISEAVITVSINATSIALPESFFLPISLEERPPGTIPFVDMIEKPNIHNLGLTSQTTIRYWDYRHNCINIIGPTVPVEIRLYYWRTLPEIVNSGSDEPMKGAKNCLAFRTAALCAEFVGGISGKSRADSLNLQAEMHVDRLMSLYTKNNQNKRVRRRPFRASYLRGMRVR